MSSTMWQCGHLVVTQTVFRLCKKWFGVVGNKFKFTIFCRSKVFPPQCGPHNAGRGSPWEWRGCALETKATLTRIEQLIWVTIQTLHKQFYLLRKHFGLLWEMCLFVSWLRSKDEKIDTTPSVYILCEITTSSWFGQLSIKTGSCLKINNAFMYRSQGSQLAKYFVKSKKKKKLKT